MFCSMARGAIFTPMLSTPRAAWGRGRLLLAAGVILLTAAAAAAHPHVWIDAIIAPVFDATNRLVAVREKWMFDVAFTEGVGPYLDLNNDGILEASEIQNAAANGKLWFIPYGYFRRVTVAGRQVTTTEVKDFKVTIPGAHMVAEFTLPLAEPAAITAPAGIDVYDAEFYVDVQFADPGIDTTLVPAACLATRREQANLDPV